MHVTGGGEKSLMFFYLCLFGHNYALNSQVCDNAIAITPPKLEKKKLFSVPLVSSLVFLFGFVRQIKLAIR